MSQSEKNIQNYRTLREQQGWADAIKKYLSEKYETPPLAHVHSFGCQQSVYDGERFKGVLAELGYGFTDDIRQADLILYNTCAVRENAEQRVFGNVGALKGLKKQKPDMVIAIGSELTIKIAKLMLIFYEYPELANSTIENADTKGKSLHTRLVVISGDSEEAEGVNQVNFIKIDSDDLKFE